MYLKPLKFRKHKCFTRLTRIIAAIICVTFTNLTLFSPIFASQLTQQNINVLEPIQAIPLNQIPQTQSIVPSIEAPLSSVGDISNSPVPFFLNTIEEGTKDVANQKHTQETPFSKLKNDIAQAQSGDTIIVKSGTYIFTQEIEVAQGVNIKAEDGVVFDAQGKTRMSMLKLLGSNSIENITFTGAGAYTGMPASAIKIAGDNVKLRNNIFKDNANYAIWMWSGKNALIEKNTFIRNYLAIQLPKDGTLIRYNTFIDNGTAINILGGERPTVLRNIIKGSNFQSIYEYGWGMEPTNGHSIVEHNALFDNEEKGGFSSINLPPAIEHWSDLNMQIDPQFMDEENGDYRIKHGSQAYDLGSYLSESLDNALERANDIGLSNEIEAVVENGAIVGYRIVYEGSIVEKFMNDGQVDIDDVGPAITDVTYDKRTNQDSIVVAYKLDGEYKSKTFNLKDGDKEYTFAIEHSDDLGNTTKKTIQITKDTVGPSISNLVYDQKTNKDEISVSYKLDGIDQTKTFSLVGLDKEYTFTIVHIDQLGNQSSKIFSVTKDTVGPNLNDFVYPFETNKNEVTLSYQIDGVINSKTLSLPGEDKDYEFVVTEADELGNQTTQVITITKDTTPPVITDVTYPSETNKEEVVVAYKVDGVEKTKQFVLDGDDGTYNFTITETDQLGNESAKSVSVIKDTTGPNLSGFVYSFETNKNEVILSYQIDGIVNSKILSLSGEDKDYEFVITEADELGNQTTQVITITKDTTPPIITDVTYPSETNKEEVIVTYKVDGVEKSKAFALDGEDGEYSFTITEVDQLDNESTQVVAIVKDTVGPQITNLVYLSETNESQVTVSYQVNGIVKIKSFSLVGEDQSFDLTILESDQLGNETIKTITVTKDTTAPSISDVRYPLETNQSEVTVDYKVDGVEKSKTFVLDGDDGEYNFVIIEMDQLFNKTEHSITINKDTVAPVITDVDFSTYIYAEDFKISFKSDGISNTKIFQLDTLGEHTVTFSISDSVGNVATQTISTTRYDPFPEISLGALNAISILNPPEFEVSQDVLNIEYSFDGQIKNKSFQLSEGINILSIQEEKAGNYSTLPFVVNYVSNSSAQHLYQFDDSVVFLGNSIQNDSKSFVKNVRFEEDILKDADVYLGDSSIYAIRNEKMVFFQDSQGRQFFFENNLVKNSKASNGEVYGYTYRYDNHGNLFQVIVQGDERYLIYGIDGVIHRQISKDSLSDFQYENGLLKRIIFSNQNVANYEHKDIDNETHVVLIGNVVHEDIPFKEAVYDQGSDILRKIVLTNQDMLSFDLNGDLESYVSSKGEELNINQLSDNKLQLLQGSLLMEYGSGGSIKSLNLGSEGFSFGENQRILSYSGLSGDVLNNINLSESGDIVSGQIITSQGVIKTFQDNQIISQVSPNGTEIIFQNNVPVSIVMPDQNSYSVVSSDDGFVASILSLDNVNEKTPIQMELNQDFVIQKVVLNNDDEILYQDGKVSSSISFDFKQVLLDSLQPFSEVFSVEVAHENVAFQVDNQSQPIAARVELPEDGIYFDVEYYLGNVLRILKYQYEKLIEQHEYLVDENNNQVLFKDKIKNGEIIAREIYRGEELILKLDEMPYFNRYYNFNGDEVTQITIDYAGDLVAQYSTDSFNKTITLANGDEVSRDNFGRLTKWKSSNFTAVYTYQLGSNLEEVKNTLIDFIDENGNSHQVFNGQLLGSSLVNGDKLVYENNFVTKLIHDGEEIDIHYYNIENKGYDRSYEITVDGIKRSYTLRFPNFSSLPLAPNGVGFSGYIHQSGIRLNEFLYQSRSIVGAVDIYFPDLLGFGSAQVKGVSKTNFDINFDDGTVIKFVNNRFYSIDLALGRSVDEYQSFMNFSLSSAVLTQLFALAWPTYLDFLNQELLNSNEFSFNPYLSTNAFNQVSALIRERSEEDGVSEYVNPERLGFSLAEQLIYLIDSYQIEKVDAGNGFFEFYTIPGTSDDSYIKERILVAMLPKSEVIKWQKSEYLLPFSESLTTFASQAVTQQTFDYLKSQENIIGIEVAEENIVTQYDLFNQPIQSVISKEGSSQDSIVVDYKYGKIRTISEGDDIRMLFKYDLGNAELLEVEEYLPDGSILEKFYESGRLLYEIDPETNLKRTYRYYEDGEILQVELSRFDRVLQLYDYVHKSEKKLNINEYGDIVTTDGGGRIQEIHNSDGVYTFYYGTSEETSEPIEEVIINYHDGSKVFMRNGQVVHFDGVDGISTQHKLHQVFQWFNYDIIDEEIKYALSGDLNGGRFRLSDDRIVFLNEQGQINGGYDGKNIFAPFEYENNLISRYSNVDYIYRWESGKIIGHYLGGVGGEGNYFDNKGYQADIELTNRQVSGSNNVINHLKIDKYGNLESLNIDIPRIDLMNVTILYDSSIGDGFGGNFDFIFNDGSKLGFRDNKISVTSFAEGKKLSDFSNLLELERLAKESSVYDVLRGKWSIFGNEVKKSIVHKYNVSPEGYDIVLQSGSDVFYDLILNQQNRLNVLLARTSSEYVDLSDEYENSLFDLSSHVVKGEDGVYRYYNEENKIIGTHDVKTAYWYEYVNDDEGNEILVEHLIRRTFANGAIFYYKDGEVKKVINPGEYVLNAYRKSLEFDSEGYLTTGVVRKNDGSVYSIGDGKLKYFSDNNQGFAFKFNEDLNVNLLSRKNVDSFNYYEYEYQFLNGEFHQVIEQHFDRSSAPYLKETKKYSDYTPFLVDQFGMLEIFSSSRNILPSDTIIKREYSSDGELESVTKADHTTTIFENARPSMVFDQKGYLLMEYIYDGSGYNTRIILHKARDDLEDQTLLLRNQVVTNRLEALHDLAVSEGVAIVQIQQDAQQARQPIGEQIALLEEDLAKLEKQKARGRRAKKAKSRALDQLRDNIHQLNFQIQTINQQEADAYAQINSQVNALKQDIDQESKSALNTLRQNLIDFQFNILKQEISPVVYDTYRRVLGRDPNSAEYEYWMERIDYATGQLWVGPQDVERGVLSSFEFDGVDDEIFVKEVDLSSQEWAIEAWFKPQNEDKITYQLNDSGVIEATTTKVKDDMVALSVDSGHYSGDLFVSQGGKISFELYTASETLILKTQEVDFSEWHYVTVTRDGDNFYLLLDGVVVDSVVNSISLEQWSSSTLRLGKSGLNKGNHYYGYINDLVFSNHVSHRSELWSDSNKVHDTREIDEHVNLFLSADVFGYELYLDYIDSNREILVKGDVLPSLWQAPHQKQQVSLIDGITQSLKESSEISEREEFVNTVKANVSSLVNQYLSLDQQAKEVFATQYGVELEDLILLSNQDATKVLDWINTRDLHFGHSAFIALEALLDQAFVSYDRLEIATRSILIDILTGVITPIDDGDLVISMYALIKVGSFYGVDLVGAKFGKTDVLDLFSNNSTERVVAHIDDNHYVIISSVDTNTVTYIDTGTGPDKNHDELTLAWDEFYNIWDGYVFGGDSSLSQVKSFASKELSKHDQMKIRGAFLPFLIPIFTAIVAVVTTAVAVVASVITTTLLTLGAVVKAAFVGLLKGIVAIGEGIALLGKGIFHGVKFAAKTLANVVGKVFSSVTAQTQAGSLAEAGFGDVVFKNAVKTGLNIATSNGLESLGVDPKLARLTSAFTTGGIHNTNFSTLSNFSPGDFVVGGLQGVTFQGINELNINPDLKPILSATANGFVTNYQGTIADTAITIAPNVATAAANVGLTRLGEQLGWDPTATQLLSEPVTSGLQYQLNNFVGNFNSQASFVESIEQGLVRGTTGFVIDTAIEESDIDPLLGQVTFNALASQIESSLGGSDIGLLDNIYRSAHTALTFSEPNTFDYQRQNNLQKILSFSDNVREDGFSEAIDLYAQSVLRQETIESVLRSYPSIKDYINDKLNADEVEIINNDEGKVYKFIIGEDEIHVDEETGKIVKLLKGALVGEGEIDCLATGCEVVNGVKTTTEQKVIDGEDAVIETVSTISNEQIVQIVSALIVADQQKEELIKVEALDDIGFRDGKDFGIFENVRVSNNDIMMVIESGDLLSLESRKYGARYIFDQDGVRIEMDDVSDLVTGDGELIFVKQDDWQDVKFVLSNGIRDDLEGENPAGYFDPEKSNSFIGTMEGEGIAQGEIAQVPLYGDIDDATTVDPFLRLSLGGVSPIMFHLLRDENLPFDKVDVFSVGIAAAFGQSSESLKITEKLNEISANQTSPVTLLGFSGGGQQQIAAANKPREDGTFHNIGTMIFVGTPIFNTEIKNPNVKTIIIIRSDKDILDPTIPYTFGDKEVINIQLSGGDVEDLIHSDYFINPNKDLDKMPDVAYLSDKFIGLLTLVSDDAEEVIDFLKDDLLVPVSDSNGISESKQIYRYEVDLFNWAQRIGLDVGMLREEKGSE